MYHSSSESRLPLTVIVLFVLLLAGPAAADIASITAADLARHVETLAADEFGGRAPGTEGGAKTIEYLTAEREIESGAKGQLNRFQFTTKYAF